MKIIFSGFVLGLAGTSMAATLQYGSKRDDLNLNGLFGDFGSLDLLGKGGRGYYETEDDFDLHGGYGFGDDRGFSSHGTYGYGDKDKKCTYKTEYEKVCETVYDSVPWYDTIYVDKTVKVP